MANIITAGNSTNGGTQIVTDTSGILNIVTGSGSGTTAISVNASQATTFAAGVSGTTGSFSGDMSFNSGYGSAAVAYGCRAWVNFNGTGTVAIRASGNVSSITDNGVGQYTVNLTTAMVDTNYSVGVNTDYDGVSFPINVKTFATTSFLVQCVLANLSNFTDKSIVNAQVFR